GRGIRASTVCRRRDCGASGAGSRTDPAFTPRRAWKTRPARVSRAITTGATSAGDYGSAERRPGDTGSDRKGTDCEKRRAHYFAHRIARTLFGLHADRRARWRLAEDRV